MKKNRKNSSNELQKNTCHTDRDDTRILVSEKTPENDGIIYTENQTVKKRKTINPWISLLIKVAVVAAVIFALTRFVEFYFMHENGMFPSIRDGDLVIASKLFNPAFNDVVIYRTTDSNGNEIKHVGRVMSLGGSRVEISEYGDTIVNDSIISTSNFYQDFDKGELDYPVDVPADCLFILQDYRPELADSRTYGPVPKQDILGKVFFVFRVRGF